MVVKHKKKPAAKPYKLYLAAFIFLLICLNLASFYKNGSQSYDFSYHFQLYSLDVFEAIKGGNLQEIFRANTYYPPLVALVTSIFYLLFGVSELSAFASLSIFLIILILSAYGIGKRLGGPQIGLFAAVISGLLPSLNGMSRQYMLDFPLAAMVCLSIYLLLRTEKFGNLKYSVLFGSSLGLGLLTKWSFFIFLVGPSAYMLWQGMKKDKGRIFALMLAVGIALVIASSWYVPNKAIFLGPYGLYADQTWNTYPGYEYVFFLMGQLSLPIFVIGLVSLAYYTLKSKDMMLLLWFVIPYIILSMITGKSARYSLPYVPAFGLAISCTAFYLRGKIGAIGRISLCVIIGFLALMCLNSAVGTPIPEGMRYENLCFARLTDSGYDSCYDYFLLVPSPRQDWQIEAALEDVVEEYSSGNKGGPGRVGVATCSIHLKPVNFIYLARVGGYDLTISDLTDYSDNISCRGQAEFVEGYNSSEFLIYQSAECGRMCFIPMDWALQNGFVEKGRYSLPGNSGELFVLKREENPSS